MNWYKFCQNLSEEWNKVLTTHQDIKLEGSGLNENLTIPNSSIDISSRELLNKVIDRIKPVLKEKHVHTIDTSPTSSGYGMAVSHEPGRIHVNVRRIFQEATKTLPPTIQTDGVEADPMELSGIVNHISEWITNELANTILHESHHHFSDFGQNIIQNKPISNISETGAENFGKQQSEKYFPRTFEQ